MSVHRYHFHVMHLHGFRRGAGTQGLYAGNECRRQIAGAGYDWSRCRNQKVTSGDHGGVKERLAGAEQGSRRTSSAAVNEKLVKIREAINF